MLLCLLQGPAFTTTTPIPQNINTGKTRPRNPPLPRGQGETPGRWQGAGRRSSLEPKRRTYILCPLQGIKPCSKPRCRGTPSPACPAGERVASPSRSLPIYDSINEEHVLKLWEVQSLMRPGTGTPQGGHWSSQEPESHSGTQ